MSEDQKHQLQTSLWNIANDLRGKMNADEFRDYILGFIFYKYLSEKLELYADELLEGEGTTYCQLNDTDADFIHESVVQRSIAWGISCCQVSFLREWQSALS